jgi:zinc transport system substrate-binding protein
MLGILCAFVVPGCSGTAPAPSEPTLAPTPTGPIDVRVSSFPAEWLVKRVGGTEVALQNVLPPGEDPPFWSPPGDVVAGMQKAELIVANGAGFEQWMQTATLPTHRIVDSARDLDHIHIQSETHSHGKEGEHSHAGLDPHTWSDPILFLQQAEVVHAALVAARPDKKATFDRNLAALRIDLTDLDRALLDALTPGRSVKMAANHPAYNYLARRYKLHIHAFDFDPETVSDASTISAFTTWASKVEKPHHLLWESQPADAVRRSFPAGTLHIYIDPLEQPGDGQAYDYLAQARRNVSTFKALFKKSAPEETP